MSEFPRGETAQGRQLDCRKRFSTACQIKRRLGCPRFPRIRGAPPSQGPSSRSSCKERQASEPPGSADGDGASPVATMESGGLPRQVSRVQATVFPGRTLPAARGARERFVSFRRSTVWTKRSAAPRQDGGTAWVETQRVMRTQAAL